MSLELSNIEDHTLYKTKSLELDCLGFLVQGPHKMLFKCKIHDFCKFNIIHGSLMPKVVSGIYCKTLHFCRFCFVGGESIC
jgi:hypothetical protein